MSAASRHEALIDRLGTELVPVRRLLSPSLRTVGWLTVVLAIGAWLVMHYGLDRMLLRWAGAPDLGWAAMGSVITMVCAAWAAFTLGVPGRRSAWAWLPLPGALLWMCASGLGCLRSWVGPATGMATVHQSLHCLIFIISFSVPLSILMVWLLRRAFPLRPVLTAVMIGLASAAASASLLQICHEFDVAATDLLTHALAVVIVVGLNAVMGGRLLSRT